jgi:inorganic phosphate transporter, PiT family
MSNIDAINQTPGGFPAAPAAASLIGQKRNPWFNVLAAVVIVVGVIYSAIHLADDLSVVRDTRAYPYILLGIALLIALGFEFVNGFHDTANAVATVIYTNSMSPNLACWSRAVPWRSESSPCCRWNSSCKSAAVPVSPWCLPC